MQRFGFILHHVEKQDVSFNIGIYQSCSFEKLQGVWVLFSPIVGVTVCLTHTIAGIWGCLSTQVSVVGVCCLYATCCTVM